MIRDLRFFLGLCRDKSIRKASQSLFISPQGLSKAMKNLEAELGVQLFTRSNEGVVPTKAGKIVAKKARGILDAYDTMLLELRGEQTLARNSVRIVCASGVIHALQPDFIYEFHNRYPEVEMLIAEYPDLACDQALLDGEAEIGFAIAPIDRRKFTSFRIYEGSLAVIANKTNPVAAKRSISFRELKKERWALPNDRYKSYHAVLSKCSELGIKPKIDMLASEIGLLLKYCHVKGGIAVSLATDPRSSGYEDVVTIPLAEDSHCPWEVHAVTKKKAPLSPAARSFLEHVRSWFDAGG